MNDNNISTSTNNQNIPPPNSDSEILKLESLIQEYNLLLTGYQQIYQTYISLTKNNTINDEWAFIKNTAFWGKSALKEGPVLDAYECLDMCKSDSQCSGATFDPSNNYCWSRKGQSSFVVSNSNQISIIPGSTAYMNALDVLNQQMIAVNGEIMKLTEESSISNLKDKNRISSETLHKNYSQLMEDRSMIDKALAENESLKNEIKETDLSVTHYHYYYYLLFLLFLFLLYLLYRNIFSSKEINNTMIGGGNFMKKIFSFHF